MSAAYAIASAADRVYVTQTGEVGSVGVVAVHVDKSGADAKAGLAWTFIFAGERKIDGNAHQTLSEPARNNIQADVDRLYEQFVALVAGNRGLSAEAVCGTEAAIYRGRLGVEIGFADRVGTVESAISDLTDELGQSEPQRTITYPNNKRSPSMAKSETEQAGDSAADVQSPTQEHVDLATSPPAPAAAMAPQPHRRAKLRPPRLSRMKAPTDCARNSLRLRPLRPKLIGSASRSMRPMR